MLRGSRGDAAGVELGSSFVERIAVNTGTSRSCPVPRAASAGVTGWARRRLTGPGRGGAAVVLRAGESPAHGEGRQRLREGREAAMPQDAPLNGSAPGPAPVGSWSRVAGMQAKLHRWAAADPGRRFDDLFNFVHDPATLVVAFGRVAGNHGANTPGVDGLTAAYVEEAVGVPGFLDDLRCPAEDGHVPAAAGAGTKDPQAGRVGETPQVRHSDGHRILRGRARLVRFRNPSLRSPTRSILWRASGCGCCSSGSWPEGWRSAVRAGRSAR